MANHAPVRHRRWLATLIITLFFVAVAGAASLGWWYARESPPHQGPIVLISVDRLSADTLPAYGADRADTPAIDALAAEAVVFDRAFAHSPQTLPSHVSMLSGQLPAEHGVRDDAGFMLQPGVRTLAELLRNRGFSTGAAVSSFLLRRESGVGQGFSFFDGEMPPAAPGEPPSAEREGELTLEAASRWVETRDNRRFFLFLQVDDAAADAVVARLAQLLKERGLYEQATIVLVGDRGAGEPFASLDDRTLHVPLIVKQPAADGAGRRVALPVQHIDLVPTILDLVRAPLPSGLRGRSLRPTLADRDAGLPQQPIFAESVAAYLRFGGHPLFAVTGGTEWLVRSAGEDLVTTSAEAQPDEAGVAEPATLRAFLERLIGTSMVPISAAAPDDIEEDRLALLGYLPGMRFTPSSAPLLSDQEQRLIGERHRSAAVLVGRKQFTAAIRALQEIVRDYPALAFVHYRLAAVLMRAGRTDEGIRSLRTAGRLLPDSIDVPLALAEAFMRTGHHELAREQAQRAVALAERLEPSGLPAAHEIAARAALDRGDRDAAMMHAEAAQAADASRPMIPFVRGRLLFEEGRYDEALAAFAEADGIIGRDQRPLAGLQLSIAETLTHLDRYAEAEERYRREIQAFPRNLQAYTGLAMLYRASNRNGAVEDVLDALVDATPTPEGYAVAAKLWTIAGNRARADALRSDARTRFREDPSQTLLGRGARR